ncbi:MAG: hypothetical protein ACFE8J_09800 [Candidatus Heimdallarchaeota archaeon]
MDYLERNYKILEEKMIDQMNISLGYGKSLIDSELDAGVLNFVVKPVVKSFYKYWSDKDASIGTLEQIKITLNSAKEFLVSGDGSKEQLDKIVDRNFPIYLENDQTDRQCKKDHKNYPELKRITKKCFITQVEESILFLKVKDEINDYNELSRATFHTKEKAYQALKRQLDYNDAGISIVEKDDSILKVPTGRNIILKVLRKGFELTKKKLIEELDLIFS